MTTHMHPMQVPTEESLQELADYLTSGYWRDTKDLKSPAGDAQERKDTRYIDGNPREEREFTYKFHGMSEAQEKLIETALQTWEDVANIEFKRVPDYVSDHESAPNITFVGANISDSDAGEASGFAWGNSVINVPDNSPDFATQRAHLSMSDEELKESEGYTDEEIKEVRKLDEKTIDAVQEASYLGTAVHEIGHALGLGHAGRYNSRQEIEEGSIFDDDSSLTSIMSYVHPPQPDLTSLVPVTPQMADIRAIQYLYGAAETRTGDTIYGFNANPDDFPNTAEIYDLDKFGSLTSFTIYDSGGIDVLDVSKFDAEQFIDLRGGTFSNIGGKIGNIAIYTDTVIEIAKGGLGDDLILGNKVSNALYGGAGDDRLYGREGDDTLFGDYAEANPVYGGDDKLEGGEGNDVLYGLAGDDLLEGGEGNDSLFGFPVTTN